MAPTNLLERGKSYEMEIDYTVERHGFDNIYHASSTASNSSKGFKRKSYGFQVFDNQKKARRCLKLIQDLNCPSIAKPHLYQEVDGKFIIVIDPVYDKVYTWLERLELNVWDYNDDESECLGFSNDVCAVLRDILRALLHIHSKGKYHGDLLNAITISKDNKVKLVGHSPRSKAKDLEEKVKKDLEDFKELVKLLINAHPIKEGLNTPVAVGLFYKLFSKFPEDAILFKDYLFFIYNNPLFWNGDRRCIFIHKMWEMKSCRIKYFDQYFTLKRYSKKIEWYKRIPRQSQLEKVLHHGNRFLMAYQFDVGILDYLRDTYNHYQQKVKGATATSIETLLYKTLPAACPQIFYAVVSMFMDSKARKKCRVMSCLKREPLVFHLQE